MIKVFFSDSSDDESPLDSVLLDAQDVDVAFVLRTITRFDTLGLDFIHKSAFNTFSVYFPRVSFLFRMKKFCVSETGKFECRKSDGR